MDFDDAGKHFDNGLEFYRLRLYEQSAGEYAKTWQILSVDLAHRPELHEHLANRLMN